MNRAVLPVLWKPQVTFPREASWTGICPGDGCKERLAVWDEILDSNDELPRASLERGYVRVRLAAGGVPVYRRSTRHRDHHPYRGRELARFNDQLPPGLPGLAYSGASVRGEAVDWGAIVVCDKCGGWAELRVPSR